MSKYGLRLLEGCASGGALAELAEEDTQVVKRTRDVRVERFSIIVRQPSLNCERLLQRFAGGSVLAKFFLKTSQVVKRCGEVGFDRHRALRQPPEDGQRCLVGSAGFGAIA